MVKRFSFVTPDTRLKHIDFQRQREEERKLKLAQEVQKRRKADLDAMVDAMSRPSGGYSDL